MVLLLISEEFYSYVGINKIENNKNNNNNNINNKNIRRK